MWGFAGLGGVLFFCALLPDVSRFLRSWWVGWGNYGILSMTCPLFGIKGLTLVE